MQFPSKTQLLESGAQVSEWNGDLFTSYKEDDFLGKVGDRAQEATQASDLLPEGVWRTNHFVEDYKEDKESDSLDLHHLTSF